MQLLLIFGAILVPLVMFSLRQSRFAAVFDLLGALAVLLASISSGLIVLAIKANNTEFTTHVHQVFMDPIFLGSTGYIGVYAVYRLLLTTANTWQRRIKTAKQPT